MTFKAVGPKSKILIFHKRVLQKTNRRTHKILRKVGFSNLSVKVKPFYPFELTSKNNGYEIRCVIKFK